MQNAFPSRDPANDDVPGAFTEIFRKLTMEEWGQLPARVVSYDRNKNVAQVQPLIMVWHTDGRATMRAEIAEVPVLALGGGGVVITFDLKKGDLGWIEASSRDISLFMQTLEPAKPGTVRLNALEDCRFVPDVFRNYKLAENAEGTMCIQSTDGGTYIQLKSGLVKVTTDGSIDLKAEKINIEATDISISASIKVAGSLEVNTVSVDKHVHISSQPGSESSPPVK